MSLLDIFDGVITDEERLRCRAGMMENVTDHARATKGGGTLLLMAGLGHTPERLGTVEIAEKLGYSKSLVSGAINGIKLPSQRFRERAWDVFRVPVESWDR